MGKEVWNSYRSKEGREAAAHRMTLNQYRQYKRAQRILATLLSLRSADLPEEVKRKILRNAGLSE